MKIFIPDNLEFNPNTKALFVLVRPFYDHGKCINDDALKRKWGLEPDRFAFTDAIEEADIMLLPNSLNYYYDHQHREALIKYSELCVKHAIPGYVYIQGDGGKAFKELPNLTYFRMGGFRTQLKNQNQGLPVAIADFYKDTPEEAIMIREKKELPVIGFCGHASLSFLKRVKEIYKFGIENSKRALSNPFRKDWEPLFASAYHRALLLNSFSKSSLVETNFVYRDRYRAGARSTADREKTSLEYFQNMQESDYVLCIRGGGNFSVRLYESLMMGRIPVFVNTDCLMPFADVIPWRKHVVWVEWKDRYQIDTIISSYHECLSASQFVELQLKNRSLWLNTLSVRGIFELLRSKSLR